ncbi:unnamed protein product [Penicillium bialowiezense]
MPESPSELGQNHSLRRSVTLPVKLNPLAQRRASVPNTPEHVIYYHPSAKIVHFAPRALAPIPSSSAPSDFDYPVDTIETLPWRSATERTVATAPLRLEKVHGSTAFLKCGNVVHAILKNSQCWCVDGVSKFVLRIRPLTYYRIEIPYETVDDQTSVQELKIALPTVLRYEVTPCPFKRAFSVELPIHVMAPRRKKAWRPKDQRQSVPAVLESPLEASSPSSTRSEWIDSASAGEDTDGNLTDDSCFTSHKASSITSETPHNNHHLSPAETPRPSSSHSISRRSVSETPQTFTSLLAKFQATPVPENCDPESEQDPESSESLGDLVPSVVEASGVPAPNAPLLPIQDEIPISSGLEANEVPESPAEGKSHAETETEHVLGAASHERNPIETVVHSESTVPAQDEHELDVEPPHFTEPEIKVEFNEQLQWGTGPGSFRSAEPQSPDSVSTHPTSVGGHDLPDPTDMFCLPNAKEIASELQSTAEDTCQKLELPALNAVTEIPESEHQTGMFTPASSRLSPNDIPRGFADAFSDTSPSMARTSTPYQYSPIPDASPESKMPTRTVAKAPTPSTDFNHMSTEFRRRSQATTERDVSPMPHSSALYKPSSGDDAKSFISKAITLVLIPPAYLFIILLHIAARVVINPPPTQPKLSGSNPNSQKSNQDSPAVDDFSFPLEPQSSSEYVDAETSRKLDPWDLD